ncbi:hypothetical protein [Chitinimonas taiwanensis]|uniref:hypothetical protein n=1 Tax=Chitinimonas taiwanensis TaxID=240412 RepID=UPI0035B05D2A
MSIPTCSLNRTAAKIYYLAGSTNTLSIDSQEMAVGFITQSKIHTTQGKVSDMAVDDWPEAGSHEAAHALARQRYGEDCGHGLLASSRSVVERAES